MLTSVKKPLALLHQSTRRRESVHISRTSPQKRVASSTQSIHTKQAHQPRSASPASLPPACLFHSRASPTACLLPARSPSTCFPRGPPAPVLLDGGPSRASLVPATGRRGSPPRRGDLPLRLPAWDLLEQHQSGGSSSVGAKNLEGTSDSWSGRRCPRAVHAGTRASPSLYGSSASSLRLLGEGGSKVSSPAGLEGPTRRPDWRVLTRPRVPHLEVSPGTGGSSCRIHQMEDLQTPVVHINQI
jgi:hypothetical protein